MSNVKLLNASIDNLSMAELLEKLKYGVVYTPNVDHLVKLQVDREFYAAYSGAEFKTCDSKILFYASKLVGVPIKEKISGSDLFPAFCQHHSNNEATKIFLLGAREGVASEAKRRINERFGRELIIGAHSPSFGFEKNEAECDRIINLINESGATVLAVGVGAPKQEKFIYQYRDRFKHVKIFLAIGATIDFEAGNVARAPKWISEMGLEWLYRLLSEPRRLWKRYLLEGPLFFWYLVMQLLNLYTDPFDDRESPDQTTNYKGMAEALDA